MKKITITLVAITFLVACTTVKLVTPTEADVTRAKAVYPDYTLADLNQGKTLYTEKCGTCHGIKNPKKQSAEQWKEIVPSMTKMANKNETRIDANQQELILKYLVTMCASSYN